MQQYLPFCYDNIAQLRPSIKQLHKQVKLNNVVNRVPVSFSKSFTCVLLFEKNIAWLWAHIFWNQKLNLLLIFFDICSSTAKWAHYAGFVSMNTLSISPKTETASMPELFFFVCFLRLQSMGFSYEDLIANPILLSKSNFFIQREFSKWRSAGFF